MFSGCAHRSVPATLLAFFLVFAGMAPAEDISLKDVRVPNFVYSDERNNICVSILNKGRTVKKVGVLVRFLPDGGKEKKVRRSLSARGRRDEALLVPFDMSDFPQRSGRIEVTVTVGGKEVSSSVITVADSFDGLEKITTKLGRLFDAEGRPCMICTDLEDPAKYRKWFAIKWVKQRADRSPKKVLMLGSRMVNSNDDEEGRYVAELERMVEKTEESFEFVPRGGGLRPIFGDMLKAGKLVSEHKPQIFIYCPGLEDIYSGVPVREFARALDVMIDQVRMREVPPRIILVTTVPLLSDMKLSEEYEKAMRKIAREHHTDIVDLREVMGRNDKTIKRYYAEDEDARVFHLYPLQPGQDLIARSIARYIY